MKIVNKVWLDNQLNRFADTLAENNMSVSLTSKLMGLDNKQASYLTGMLRKSLRHSGIELVTAEDVRKQQENNERETFYINFLHTYELCAGDKRRIRQSLSLSDSVTNAILKTLSKQFLFLNLHETREPVKGYVNNNPPIKTGHNYSNIRSLREANETAIISDAERGFNVIEIAERNGCTRDVVVRLLRRNKLKPLFVIGSVEDLPTMQVKIRKDRNGKREPKTIRPLKAKKFSKFNWLIPIENKE